MLLCPPGSGKSAYGSVVFPSKYLADEPGRRLILTSYGSDLARKMGRRTRSIIRQERYKRITGVSLSQDSGAADQFMLSNGSEYMASGLLAGITGNRATGAVLDDPLAGREAANSVAIRDKTWEAYQDDLLTRLIPGGWLAMILTHWSEEDPAGKILPEDWAGESGMIKCRDGMVWNVVCLQARCETHTDPLGRKLGEYLWPEWFDSPHWAQFESVPATWNSLFQQRPRPPEGAFFLEASLLENSKPVQYPPFCDAVFSIVDSASKTNNEHDGTAVVWCAYTKNGGPNGPVPKLVILDWDYHQIQGASLELWLPTVFTRGEELARLCKARLGSKGALIEDKDSGVILLQQAKNKRWPATPINSKLTALGKKGRAFNASPYVAAGDVKISEHAYRKVVTYKGSTKNHLMSQILYFTMESKDNDPVDLLDATTYAISLACGNLEGF